MYSVRVRSNLLHFPIDSKQDADLERARRALAAIAQTELDKRDLPAKHAAFK
jgi:hypothetical protein